MNGPSCLVISIVLFVNPLILSEWHFKMRIVCEVWSKMRVNVVSEPEIVTHSYLRLNVIAQEPAHEDVTGLHKGKLDS